MQLSLRTKLTHPDTIYHRFPIDNRNGIHNGRSQDRCDKFERNQLYFQRIRLCLYEKSTKKLVTKTINIYNDTSNCRNIFASLSEIYILLSRMLFALFFVTAWKNVYNLYFTRNISVFTTLFIFFSKNKRTTNPLNFLEN